MGLKYHNLESAPEAFDVVWCLWPNRGAKLEPGVVRPVLVLDSRTYTDDRTGEQFKMLTVQYGGHFEAEHLRDNLVIGAHECKGLGLHKSTVFRLDVSNRKKLPWAERYFLPQSYVIGQNIISGRLTESQQKIVLECLHKRGLAFPPP